MIRQICFVGCILSALANIQRVQAAAVEHTVIDAPVKVTATLQPLAEGGTEVQFSVHNGPLAHVVTSTLLDVTESNAERRLRREIRILAPYLLIHSGCTNTLRRCGGYVVFRLAGNVATRLGDIADAEATQTRGGRFYDRYDKLDDQVSFSLVLTDAGSELRADGEQTWLANLSQWQGRMARLSSSETQGAKDPDQQYYDALIAAAIARYCGRHEELQQVLDAAALILNADRRRSLTDTLSQIAPLEEPKRWRHAL